MRTDTAGVCCTNWCLASCVTPPRLRLVASAGLMGPSTPFVAPASECHLRAGQLTRGRVGP